MLDDLRNSASSFIEEEAPLEEEIVRKKRKKGQPKNFLGMTPPQRFLIALVLLLMTCVCGIFALLIFEKIVPPFF
ncbi:MAG: hypothetical protein HPY59_04780 [Anaerolineae bacterium]|nr:hypothetical protein [Anaerolineae bacterium]